MIEDALGIGRRGFDIHIFDGVRRTVIGEGVRIR